MDYLKQNLSLIKRQWPDIENLLDGVEVGGKVQVKNDTPSGLPSFSYGNGNGQRVFFHSLYNPVREAYQVMEGRDLSDVRLVFVLGLGFAYHVQHLIKNAFFQGDIYILEPSLEIFKAACQNRDLSDILSNSRVHLFIQPDVKQIRGFIYSSGFFDTQVHKTELIYLPAYRQVFQPYYEEALDAINVKFSMNSASMVVAEELSRNWERNTLANLAMVFRSVPLTNFFDRFKGFPGIIVSAGPSLDKNIHLLKALQSKAVIISVGTALKKLLTEDIIPDFAVAIDASELTLLQFEEISDTKGVCLLADVCLSPQIVRMFWPRVCFLHTMNNQFINWFCNKKMVWKTKVYCGGSVAHVALDIAAKFGCNPIVFTGQDYCFEKDGRSHAQGTMYDGKRTPIDLSDTFSFRMLEGNFDKEVIVPRNFYLYIRWTEEFIERRPQIEFINSTAGGVRIKGAKIMPLDEVAKVYAKNNLSIGSLVGEMIKKIPDHLSLLMRWRLHSALRQLKALDAYFVRGADLSREMVGFIRSEKTFSSPEEETRFLKDAVKFFKKLGRMKAIRLFEESMKVDSQLMSFSLGASRIKEKGFADAIACMPATFKKLIDSSERIRSRFDELTRAQKQEVE